MPFITREDGIRFIIPSYRDTIIAKKASLLKKEILLLSASYGEYITLQKKNVDQYEVAFSPESGYLLGECVWNNFKRPLDLIYCEAIPNSTEAILVIVKAGSVYLDGSFPLDSIPEELVIFKTQQNNFQIYVYGDVPIAKTEDEGKFAFESSSVKSFTVLDAPVFPTLPTIKAFQLQLVDPLLKSQGIGVLPIKQVMIALITLGIMWMGWTYLTQKPEVVETLVSNENPYQQFEDQLTSPSPQQEIDDVLNKLKQVQTIPGWEPISLEYTLNSNNNGKLRIKVTSFGVKVETLIDWAYKYNANTEISTDGIYLNFDSVLQKRVPPTKVDMTRSIVAQILDRLANVIPDNNVVLGSTAPKKNYSETTITYNIPSTSPSVVSSIGSQFYDLPVVLTNMSLKVADGNLQGSLTLKALGN